MGGYTTPEVRKRSYLKNRERILAKRRAKRAEAPRLPHISRAPRSYSKRMVLASGDPNALYYTVPLPPKPYSSEKYREYRAKNPEKYEARRISALARARSTKLAVFQHYSQMHIPVCACCGESHYEFLTIDHINGGGYKHRQEIAGRGSHFYSWLFREGFPEGYRVLCYNCNCSKGHCGYCPHGNL